LFGVGQSFVVNGVRGSTCGGKPPSFAQIKPNLPRSRKGTFSDGGVGWKFSYSCQQWVRVRAVVFNAKAKGEETFEIYGDETTVTVR